MLTFVDLRNVDQKEKESSHLTKLPKSFYSDAADYIHGLDTRMKTEEQKEQSSKKTVLLSDELRNARRLWGNIIARREKKIVLLALSMARGGSAKPENLTPDEHAFFDKLQTLFDEHRQQLRVISSDTKILVRILEEVPSFVDSSMKQYVLKKEDVVLLPPEIADVLIKRGVAEKVDPEL